MSTSVVVLAALGSALGAAGSSALQHRAARLEVASAGGSLGLVVGLVRRPLWLAGLAAASAGLVLHALALIGGRLVVVQPLLVSGLLFALPLSLLLEGRRPRAGQLSWALLLIAGLSTFLAAAGTQGSTDTADSSRLALVTGLTLTIITVAVTTARNGRLRSVVLGFLGGVAFGVTSALLKEVAFSADGLSISVFSSWPFWALLAAGAAAIATTQLAYSAGPLAESLPGMTIGDPLASVAIGMFVFHERLAGHLGGAVVEVLGFALMMLAAVQLVRTTER